MPGNISPSRIGGWCLLLGLLWSLPISSTTRTVIVNVDLPPLAWSDSQLELKLVRNLSRLADGRMVITRSETEDKEMYPDRHYNLDSLVDWGKQSGGHYLLLVEVDALRLEKRKSFHLPLIFHKYETVGVIEGELRLIDISRKKALIAEPFQIEQKGPRIFQATMDDDINDPDTHLTAVDKLKFFDRMEEKLARHICRRADKVMHLR